MERNLLERVRISVNLLAEFATTSPALSLTNSGSSPCSNCLTGKCYTNHFILMVRVACYNCGTHEAVKYASENGFDLVKCQQCGLLYVNPRPEANEIIEGAEQGLHHGDVDFDLTGRFAIIQEYIQDKKPDDFLFPILTKDTPPHRVHRVKNDKIKWFNKRMVGLAKFAGIKKKVTSYTPRDSWTNIGLDMGIDIRQISSGLGHSSVSVTDKHYGKAILEKILDEVNEKITSPAKEAV